MKKYFINIFVVFFLVFILNTAYSSKVDAAVLLGRVFLGGYQGCSRYYFGTACGGGACMGGPDYKVTWYQAGNTSTVFSNSCEGGIPRYTFEKLASPSGSKTGVLTDIEFEFNYPMDLTTWYLNATNDRGNTCAPVQVGNLVRSGNRYKVVGAKIYDFKYTRNGNSYDCNWNHFWMYTPEGTVYVTPTVVPSVTPVVTPTVTPGITPILTPNITPTTAIPSPGVNTPPSCSVNPLIKNPNKTFYLPGEKVNLIAANYTDANNDVVTVTNWYTSSGTLTNTLADKTTLTLPSTSNTVTTVSYVISDGKSNTTCSSTFNTKMAYSCLNNSCSQNGEGAYTTYNDCLLNCSGSGLYSCTQNGQCVFDPSGGSYSNSSCNNECSVSQVTCEQINVGGTLTVPGSLVDLSAVVRNFVTSPSTYQWISQNSSIDISTDPNCNQTTKICTMDPNKSYTTQKVKYTVPATNDTIYFKVNNSIVPICRLNVNNGNGSSKDILLNFRQNIYNINVGNNSDVILDIKPLDNFSNYLLNLTCTINSTGQPCPIGSYKFAQSSSTQLQTGTLTSSQVYSKNIVLNFSSTTQITLNVIGDVIPEDLSLRRFADTVVNIQNPNPLSYSVKYNNNFLSTKQEYCTQNTGASFNDITINLGKISETPNTYNLSLGQTLPTTIVDGNYSVSANLNTSGVPQEIKCVMVNGAITESNATTFAVNNTSINITYVLGPVEGDSWYQAFGGNAYSFGGFSSPILTIGSKIVQTIGNIFSGVVLTNSVLNVPDVSNMPDKYAIYSGSPLVLKNLDSIKLALNNTGISKINNINQINYSADTNFYYYEGDLNLNSNLQKSGSQKIPVVFVSGNINISNNVTTVDAYLISDKTINIGNDSTLEMNLAVRGGLVCRNSFNFNSLKKVTSVNGKLTESIYFDPSIYFTNSVSSMYFKSVNIFANVID